MNSGLAQYQPVPEDEESPSPQHVQKGKHLEDGRMSQSAIRALTTVAVSLAFMLVSTALIVANKHIVKDLGFR
jgi:hypothetical protein